MPIPYLAGGGLPCHHNHRGGGGGALRLPIHQARQLGGRQVGGGVARVVGQGGVGPVLQQHAAAPRVLETFKHLLPFINE